MSDRDDLARDDGRVWGFIEQGKFVVLPKGPMLRAGLGPPPFDVIMPDQQIRRVIHSPDELSIETDI
jgi:hypothetical protein